MTHIDRHLESYCVLCRVPLPRNEYNPNLPQQYACPDKNWDADVVLFFNVACQDSHPTAYYRGIFRVNLRDHHTQRKVQQYAIRKDLDFCRWNLDCAECARSRSKSVHYAHLDCYKLAYNLYPALSLDHLELIAKFGSTVLPGVMMPPSPPAPTANGHQIFFSNKRNQGTELGQLMATVIGQLPIELQHMIWSHTGALLKSISTCIWNLHHQFRPYLTADIDKYPEVSSFPLSVGPKIERLGVKMINILGEDTIAEIGTGAQDWHHHISVANVKVNALQTSFGTHGLVAVRVLYEDGSKSPWVGGHSRKWFRTCKGSDLKRMRVTFDGFKIIELNLPADAGDPNSHRYSALWDINIQPYPRRIFPLIDCAPIPNGERAVEPTRRVARYLSVDPTQERIRCLTVYIGQTSTSYLQVNGDSGRRVGVSVPDYQQRAITHYFHPGESIESLHLLTQDSNRVRSGPFVVLVTSTGRTMYFGPYLLPLDISGVLTSVGDYRTHKVVGIVSETLSTLKSMGAALEPRDGEAVEDLHHLVSFPRREALGSTDDVFNRPHISRHIILSRASLADVVCVKSQKAYGRCVGLYIEHGNGVIEVLGQWDPADKGSICDVFEDRNGGTLDAITFVYSDLDQPSDRTVESIVVGRGEGIDIPKFVWDDHTRELAWLFYRLSDHLEYWNGTTRNVRIPATDTGNSIINLE